MDIVATLKMAYQNAVLAFADACSNPKPTVTLDNKSVAWGDYIKILSDNMKAAREELAAVDVVEIHSILL